MSVIDVESLLSEIAADAPCGEDLEYDSQFVEMEKQSQGTPERQYGDTIIPGEPPDRLARGEQGGSRFAGAHP